MSRLVTALWRGEVALVTTFWEYGVLYAILVNGVFSVASLMLFTGDEPLLGLIVHFLPTPYNVLMVVAIWRSAGKYQGDRRWAIAARIAAVIGFPVAIAV